MFPTIPQTYKAKRPPTHNDLSTKGLPLRVVIMNKTTIFNTYLTSKV
jgi:hypothetical protein